MMAAGTSSLSCLGVVLAKKMQEVSEPQLRRAISLARFVYQKWKGDTRFLAKHPRISAISQSNCGQSGSYVSKRLLVFAQLRDVLAAKDSPVVPEKN